MNEEAPEARKATTSAISVYVKCSVADGGLVSFLSGHQKNISNSGTTTKFPCPFAVSGTIHSSKVVIPT
jgi:hypothetical protein